jgi:peroxiredoxin
MFKHISQSLGILFCVLFLVSCGSDAATKSGFSIKGKITNTTETKLTISELTPNGLITLDTAKIEKDGSFELTGKVTESVFAIINLQKGSVLLVLDSTSNIALSIDANNPEKFGVKGSPDTEQLRKLLELNNTYMQAMRNLETKYAQYLQTPPPPALQQVIRNEYDSIMQSRLTNIQQFTLNQSSALAAYFATNFLISDPEYVYFDKIDKQFYANNSSSKYARVLHTKVENLRRTAIGEQAPDIVLNDPYGKSVALSSLRGKYVLVDFWASWCKPCRMENPNVVRLYNKFKARGFEVFSVSLDDNKDAWVKAINDDKLLWTHVSDLKKWSASVVPLYNIESIPYTVLLDKDGKIVAKNLRGEALSEKLAELLP